MTTRRRVPWATLLVAAAGMGGLTLWGIREQAARSGPGLGGRYAIEAPAWAAGDYAAMCRESRWCVKPYSAITWYAVDTDTLPTVVCQKGREVWGCYEALTGAITLAGRHRWDSVLVRHELQHAALERISPSAHPCAWFTFERRTLWLGAGCDG